ncbi:MAG: hypothetical protein L0332_11500 [Chloroflexi bacterium]|nr:hypothetical protein [Chloroflexota bacterium]MCI0580699.1 hypothetical protein [Chloroflexota bacterium]MCI0648570.1 hypothetical protein [Chloroflexota bacterium]MCI0727333.1 hypothetical protein [Chloroflexota bacterium]
MAQWYAQLVFKGDTLLSDSLADWTEVDGVLPAGIEANGRERYTTVIVSGYALYGRLRGYYALGVAHVAADPATGRTYYLSEESALHKEPVDSLTATQRAAIREWLVALNQEAWENSTEAFRESLEGTIPDKVTR